MFDPQRIPIELRAKAIFALLLGVGIGGFLFLCVAASTYKACYVDPCLHPLSMSKLYQVNSSVCFAGATTGMFFCFLSGWGALLTLRRRSSVMGFGHFFGASCVTFIMAVQSAGMWGAESALMQFFSDNYVEVTAYLKDNPIPKPYHIKPNKPLHRASKFLYTDAVLISIAIMLLAPLYFVSRDVYDDPDVQPNRAKGDSTLNSRARSRRSSFFRISSYEPDADLNCAGERQFLGHACIPMRNMKPQYKRIPDADMGVI